MSPELWTPDGVDYVQSWEPVPGFVSEEGERVFKHEFRLSFKGETQMFGVMAEESTSDAQIEDMAAKVSETTAKQIIERLQRRGSKLIPEELAKKGNWDVRRELASVWRDYIGSAKRRAASTTGKIYYSGIQT